MSVSITGGCLCGAVRYEVTAESAFGGNCYCTDCRRASGTGHCSHMGVPGDGYAVTGALKSFEKPADSGNVVARSFCPTCGSAVHSTNSGMPGMIFVRASSLDDPSAFSPAMTVYASRAPEWDAPPAGLPTFDEMPPADAQPS